MMVRCSEPTSLQLLITVNRDPVMKVAIVSRYSNQTGHFGAVFA